MVGGGGGDGVLTRGKKNLIAPRGRSRLHGCSFEAAFQQISLQRAGICIDGALGSFRGDQTVR